MREQEKGSGGWNRSKREGPGVSDGRTGNGAYCRDNRSA